MNRLHIYVHDIQLGLGWRWDSPVVMNENICDVVGKADHTTKSGPVVDPVLAKALTPKSTKGASTPRRVVSSILNTIIDDVVYASPEVLVGSIMDELIARAVPRPLPPPKVSKQDDPKREKHVDPGAKSGSATSKEVKHDDMKVVKKATVVMNDNVNDKKAANKASAVKKDKVNEGGGKVVSSPVHVVSFGKGNVWLTCPSIL